MNEKRLYYLRSTGNPLLNYCFDKISSCIFFFLKQTNTPIKNPKKILFIRNDHIGDMVYSTGTFREVKKMFPNTRIIVLATPSNKEIIEKNKNVDKIIESYRFWDGGIRIKDYIRVLREIKKESPDVGIDLRRSKLNIFFYLFVPRIKMRASYYNINGGKAFLTHPLVCEKGEVNIKEIAGMVGRIFGRKIKNYWPEIQTDKKDEDDVKSILHKYNLQKYVVFAPGATADFKRWPEKKFGELIRIFHKRYPKHKIVLTGSKSDENLIRRLSKQKKYCTPLINFNLRKISLIFKNSEAVVANDGCGTDIGWVSGGKLITLVGPIDKKLHIPQKNTIIIHHPVQCYPCRCIKSCKKPFGIWCMDLITVSEVMKAIKTILK